MRHLDRDLPGLAPYLHLHKTQGIRARPFDQHRGWNRTNNRSLLPASGIEGGARSSKRTQRWTKWGRRYGGEPIVSGWTVVCVPHAGIMHGHLGLRGKAMHYRRIPEGLGWVGRRLFGMHTGKECNEGDSIAYNGHHDRTIAPVVLHGRASCGGDQACPDG